MQDGLYFEHGFADDPQGAAGGLPAPVGDQVDGDVGQAEQATDAVLDYVEGFSRATLPGRG